MKKCFVVSFLCLVLSVVAACSKEGTKTNAGEEKVEGGNNEQIVLKYSHVATPTSIKGLASDKFAELVAEKTNDKVKVEVYPSSQLYGDQDELDALLSGNVQMINPSVSKLVKIDPRWQFADMPYLFKDTDHVHKFFESDVAQSLLTSERLTQNGIIGLAFWENGFKNFSNDKKPLKAPEDLKGLNFRTQAGQVLEKQFESLGAGSTTIAWGETYSALQQGVADGAEATPNMMETASLQEVQKYLTLTEHGRVDYVVLVNKEFWDSLPDELEEQVMAALQEATEYEWEIAADFNKKSLEELKNKGMEVTELSEDDKEKFREALKPVYDEFTDVITPEIIDGIKELE